MKARLIDAAAFAIGMVAACLAAGRVDEFPWLLRIFLTVLSPGYFLGLPIVFLVGWIGLFSFGFVFFVAILFNGLVYGLTSFLIRNALKGQRAARLVLISGTVSWIIWGAAYTVQAWPWPEKVAPLVLASPAAGRWEGVLHAPRGNRHVTLVCHPRADSTLDGYLYVHGEDMGPFEEGTYTPDSLSFGIVGFEYRARYDRKRMLMTSTVSGISDSAELQFVSADTSRPAPAAVDFESPLAGRWDGVMHAPSGNRAINLVFHPRTDGTLRVHFYSDSVEQGRIWDEAWSGDSLRFRLERIPYHAHFDSTAMSLEWVIVGKTRSMELRRVGPDTTGLARPPRPNRWVQLPARGN